MPPKKGRRASLRFSHAGRKKATDEKLSTLAESEINVEAEDAGCLPSSG
jgi:hypothetical protein